MSKVSINGRIQYSEGLGWIASPIQIVCVGQHLCLCSCDPELANLFSSLSHKYPPVGSEHRNSDKIDKQNNDSDRQ